MISGFKIILAIKSQISCNRRTALHTACTLFSRSLSPLSPPGTATDNLPVRARIAWETIIPHLRHSLCLPHKTSDTTKSRDRSNTTPANESAFPNNFNEIESGFPNYRANDQGRQLVRQKI